RIKISVCIRQIRLNPCPKIPPWPRRRRKNIPWLRQLHYTSFRIPCENLCAHRVNNNSLNFHIILAYTQMANLTLYSQKELSMGNPVRLLTSPSKPPPACEEAD